MPCAFPACPMMSLGNDGRGPRCPGQDSAFGALRARAATGCGCLLCYRFAEGCLKPGMATSRPAATPL